jgi:hypothetical protein
VATQNIRKKIDDFFADDQERDPDVVKTFLGDLTTAWSNLERAEHRSLFSLVIVYVLFTAISFGFVAEGQFASFKIVEVRKVIIVAAPILAFLCYRYVLFASASRVVRDAVSGCFKHLLPKAYELDLEELIGPPTTLTAERILRPEKTNRFYAACFRIWNFFLVLAPVLGTLAAILQILNHEWKSDVWSPLVIISVGAIAVIIWFRALTLMIYSSEM